MGILQNIAGLGDITEQVIATDFLIAAKAGVQNYAVAISETVSPQVREVLRKQLDTAVGTHEKIFRYMQKKGYYNAGSPAEQIKIDLNAAETVLNIQQ